MEQSVHCVVYSIWHFFPLQIWTGADKALLFFWRNKIALFSSGQSLFRDKGDEKNNLYSISEQALPTGKQSGCWTPTTVLIVHINKVPMIRTSSKTKKLTHVHKLLTWNSTWTMRQTHGTKYILPYTSEQLLLKLCYKIFSKWTNNGNTFPFRLLLYEFWTFSQWDIWYWTTF